MQQLRRVKSKSGKNFKVALRRTRGEGLRLDLSSPAVRLGRPQELIFNRSSIDVLRMTKGLMSIGQHSVWQVSTQVEMPSSGRLAWPCGRAKTDGWKKEDQQGLVVALRATDPTAVYEAWAKGNSQGTAGGEIAARQTDVKRIMAMLLQDTEKNKAAIRKNVADLDTAIGKIAGATPSVSDLTIVEDAVVRPLVGRRPFHIFNERRRPTRGRTTGPFFRLFQALISLG